MKRLFALTTAIVFLFVATSKANAAANIDLSIRMSHTGNFAVGSPGNYAIKVTNIGRASTTGPVVVVDTLPTLMSFNGYNGKGWSCVQNGPQVTCITTLSVAPYSTLPILTIVVAPTCPG